MDGKTDKRFVPAYLNLTREAIQEKIERAGEILKSCTLCPRNCRVDRTAGEVGFCGTGHQPYVASWNPHFGEEAPLVGHSGSGTIFFSHCNLGCLFCQNWTISHAGAGGLISCKALANIMLVLQQGHDCHNINCVTPTHQVYQILKALEIAIEGSLRVPLVYNCGGYEALETLQLLEGVIDIYMPDFKFADPEVAEQYAKAGDYPAVARAALKEMHRQVGDLVLDSQGIAQRGLLVRHLVLPEGLAGTREIVAFLAEEISPDTYTNIMDQYTPCYLAGEHPPLDRRPTREEHRRALKAAREAGLSRLDGVVHRYR